MKVWQFPLVRITIWFVFGILFAYYNQINIKEALVLVASSTIVLGVAYFYSKKELFPNPLFGYACYIFFFTVGISTFVLHCESNQKSNYINQISSSDETHLVQIVLREKLKSSPIQNRYIALVNHIDKKPCSGKILVSFSKKQFPTDFQIGTQVQLYDPIIRPRASLNPNQFDYSKYLINKSIVGQITATSANTKISKTFIKDAFYFADLLRNKILKNLKSYQFNSTELTVLAALILGQQQDISPAIVHDYQWAGAIHILSVSGLHVGFLVLFLNFFLRYLPKNKGTAYLKVGITLCTLWGFAILAGLSPSVIRSVTMFSFVAVGMHLNRKTTIYHTLIASLFLILLFEPAFLFDVGFQLSYIALFSILWIQPLMNLIWKPRNKIISYFWSILTVSFAAQIGTFPISIYYFHQFPGLFFLTNLVVIPFLSIIMGLGLLVVILAAVNWIPQLLITALEKSILFLDKVIHSIASWDHFVVKNIACNEWILLGLYAFVITLVLTVKRPSFYRLSYVLIATLLLQWTYFNAQWTTENKIEWIVFNTPKSTLIVERRGKEVTVFADHFSGINATLEAYLVANFSHIKAVQPIQNLANFNLKKIVIIDQYAKYPRNMQPDYLVVRQSPKINLDRVFLTCKPKVMIADASNYKSYAALWSTTCAKEKIPFHNTNEKGFFRLD